MEVGSAIVWVTVGVEVRVSVTGIVVIPGQDDAVGVAGKTNGRLAVAVGIGVSSWRSTASAWA